MGTRLLKTALVWLLLRLWSVNEAGAIRLAAIIRHWWPGFKGS